MSVEKVKKYNLDQMRNDVYKLKEVFVDTIKFAIDKDLVKYLYTLLMLQNFHKKVGIYRIDVNEIVMLGESLEDIKLELSYLEIRKQYNLDPLLVETYKDMTDSEKIEHMLFLIQHGLDLQDDSDYLDLQDDSDDLDLQDD